MRKLAVLIVRLSLFVAAVSILAKWFAPDSWTERAEAVLLQSSVLAGVWGALLASFLSRDLDDATATLADLRNRMHSAESMLSESDGDGL